ncbi:uncharacterized membrane protein YcaP (DUF421 family) [Bacillus pakistanensis]|uniref:Uncharacterized membrane protein YcaP (DUF421 family) n=1 Tax=Rossellomorea pakistanensis TaxID=992288 RepID=A0ABS2N716_9BACI|nr:DUF421 domain-containing protein [Bacillus pakistanensis]MBM7583632.1 uncharacterized membrane protein YcaP (DUF421 family) [Bacillus pakistanensis]
MEFDWIWKAVLIVIAGTFLLRIAGRKSISQMTLAQTVIMVGIGSLLIQPVAGKSIWTTIAVGAILILTLIVLEYAQLKSDNVEKLITGKAKILIENGNINEKNLRKLRFTVDQLEMKLRQQNVSKINDVKYATLEPNGQVGYELKQEAQPVTKQEFQLLQQDIQQIKQLLNPGLRSGSQQLNQPNNQQDLFDEVAMKAHDKNTPPKHLQ